MRRNRLIFGLFALILLTQGCGNSNSQVQSASKTSPSDTASIFFREYEHDFGKISEGEKVGCVFTFENRGTAPLVVTSAVTSCGCTVPKFDKKPVPPGGIGTVEVIFDSSGRGGVQTKTITVQSNATKPLVLLRITGEVIINSNNN